MFGNIGNFAIRHRFWVILAWILAALLLFFFAPALSQVGTMTESNFLPQDSESLRARQLTSEYFPQNQSASTVTLVFYNSNQLSNTDLEYAHQVSDWLSSGETSFKVANVSSIFTNPELETRLVSPDKTTMLLSAGLEKVAFESDSLTTTQAIRNHLTSKPESLEIYVSGQVGVYSDLFESLNKSISLTTLITIILVIVLLIVIFRSPIAALVPLLTIGMAFLVARGVMGFIGSAGVSIWSQIEIFLIVMIFGIGTDYCLFLVSRFREELGRHSDRKEALKASVSKIGVVIAASAFAVIVGMAGMAVARYQMIQTMGPLLGVAILFTLLAALTLAPALASIFGHKLFWPLHEAVQSRDSVKRPGLWDRVARLTTSRPVIVAGAAIVVMLIPYLALPSLNRSFDQLAEIPANSESVAGFRVLQQHYDVGEMDPLTIILVAPEGQNLTNPDALKSLNQISDDLKQVNSVVKVQSILQPDGSGQTLSELTIAGQLSSIGNNIQSSFSSSNNDPSVLFSDSVGAGFTQVSNYLEELAANFDWVRNESSFQGMTGNLTTLQKAVDQIKSAALVKNQLQQLSLQINQLGSSLVVPGASVSSQAGQAAGLIKAYLDELSTQYPSIKSDVNYQSTYAIVSDIPAQLALLSALPPDQQQSLLTILPQYVQKISSGLSGLAASFNNKQSYLFSQVLAQASQEASPMDTLKSQFSDLNTNLQNLIQRFKDNGDPAFLSSTLMTSSAEAQNLMNLFFSSDRKATKLYVVLDSFPQSDAALNAVSNARTAIHASLKNTSLDGAEAVIGGTSAELADVRQVLDQDFTRIMIVVLAAIFIVLALLLRSLVAPLYLLATVLLSYGTTLGIVSWIFQGVLGQDGVSFLIPIIVLVLLVALGSDYNIFLMSRVKEESQFQTTRMGARLAAIATGGVITACGIILAGTFGALVITPIRTLMQIGSAVAIGVLIDTFIVRALLVPAVASLLGKWNWWPTKHG